MAYYFTFLLIQYGLSRFHKQILDARYLLPAPFDAGIAVGFTFVKDFGFLFWILYRKDMGTILRSVLAVEILLALINFTIVRRVSRA
jgi:hypothetical protein